jgi:sporadic carbohydrate cluster protein (TIGR04323 family)
MQQSVELEPIQANEIDAELERSLTHEWDAQIITYPNERFPFNEWIRNRIHLMGYSIDDLSYFHEVVPEAETYRITKQLCADTNLPEFRRLLNRFVREVVVPKGKLRQPVAVQRFMNVRIMLPTTPELFFPLHTGLLYGHGVASRSLWLPFVDVTSDEDKTRAMQIIPIKKSRELVRYAIDNKLTMRQMTEVWSKYTHQIKAGPGSCCLFSQEHIHGSGMPNTTGKTRISMDFRIAEAMYGDLLGRKIPAGYFHIIPNTEEEEEHWAQQAPRQLQFKNGKQNIFYVANNTAATYSIPVHLQRYMMYDYAEKNELSCDYELFDLEDMLHCPTLWHLVEERNANIVMYSIFALPEEQSERERMLRTALERANIIHFVNENLQLVAAPDLATVQKYLEFARYGQSRLPIGLPFSDLTKAYFDRWAASMARFQHKAADGESAGKIIGAALDGGVMQGDLAR